MRRLLIVDDEPKVCDYLKAFFSAKGLAVEVAFTGADAIERLMEHPVEAILLDICLPDMSGLEVLKRAKELSPEATIIMVTALDQEESKIDAKVYGATSYVTKPFDLSDPAWDLLLTDLH
jgi:DNA-binding response OmpR family regulator